MQGIEHIFKREKFLMLCGKWDKTNKIVRKLFERLAKQFAQLFWEWTTKNTKIFENANPSSANMHTSSSQFKMCAYTSYT